MPRNGQDSRFLLWTHFWLGRGFLWDRSLCLGRVLHDLQESVDLLLIPSNLLLELCHSRVARLGEDLDAILKVLQQRLALQIRDIRAAWIAWFRTAE